MHEWRGAPLSGLTHARADVPRRLANEQTQLDNQLRDACRLHIATQLSLGQYAVALATVDRYLNHWPDDDYLRAWRVTAMAYCGQRNEIGAYLNQLPHPNPALRHHANQVLADQDALLISPSPPATGTNVPYPITGPPADPATESGDGTPPSTEPAPDETIPTNRRFGNIETHAHSIGSVTVYQYQAGRDQHITER